MNGLLFIDDEEGIRRSLRRALKRERYPVYTADNGLNGIAFFREHIVSIGTVISDFKMPGIDGLETLSIIESISPEVTRIILTGYATMEAAIRATNDRIDGFLTKPFDNHELRSKIQDINIRKRLKLFVPEQVYREINRSPEGLGPVSREVSVLFSDIRGFTRMSQDAGPEDLAAFLNTEYFTPMGEIVFQRNGTVDKHIGDSIMVVFGAPNTGADDALNAVETAIVMQEAAREIDRNLSRNGFKLRIGIGIATGKVFCGIFGSIRRKEFTSIGMTVNIAARLEKIAGEGEILIDDVTFQKLAGRLPAAPLPPMTIRGVEGPVNVHRVSY
jgi:adenylate cyclase